MQLYHSNNGDLQNPIVSQSNLNKLDPEQGGHPVLFAQAILGQSPFLSTPSLEKGDLLHHWIEKPNEFLFSDVTKPSGQMADFADEFYKLYNLKQYELSEEFKIFEATPLPITMDSVMLLNKIYPSISGKIEPSNEEINILGYCILFARTKAEVNKALKQETVFEKFSKECILYLDFLKKADGKIACDRNTKNILINSYDSLKRHKFAKELLFHAENKHEEESYWEETHDGIVIQRKAKLDIWRELPEYGRVVDLKTTGEPIGKFLSGSYTKYNYGGQITGYGKRLTQKLNKPSHCYNVVVETHTNHITQVIATGVASQQFYTNKYNDLMKRLAYHIKHQVWDVTMEEHMYGCITV